MMGTPSTTWSKMDSVSLASLDWHWAVLGSLQGRSCNQSKLVFGVLCRILLRFAAVILPKHFVLSFFTAGQFLEKMFEEVSFTHLLSSSLNIFAAYLVVATEEFGRQIPFAFLERVRDDFKRRYGGGKADTAIAHALDKDFGYVILVDEFVNLHSLV